MKVFSVLWDHRTKMLGFIQVTLGVLSTTDGLFTPLAVKCILLGSGISTAWLGFFNSSRLPRDP